MKQSNNYQNIYLENQYKYEQEDVTNTVQKMISTLFPSIWSHLPKISLMKNFIFCLVGSMD